MHTPCIYHYVSKIHYIIKSTLGSWEVLFQHDLLSSSVQRFSEGIGAGNGHSGVPSVIGAKHSIDASEDEGINEHLFFF